MLKFSIIVPIYNVEKHLSMCLDSIINQTYNELEIILVDDGSLDKCPEICDKYASIDSRIKVLHKPNGGLVHARQTGAALATGDYVCCIDGDDYISSEYIMKFAEAAMESSPDIICTGMVVAYKDRSIYKYLPYEAGYYDRERMENVIWPELIQDKDAKYFRPSVWAKAFKRELYVSAQCLVNQNIRIGEDGACTIGCVFHANSMRIIHDCPYYYRQNEQSMTKEKKPFEWDAPKQIANTIRKQVDLSQFDFQEQLYRKVVHDLFLVTASQFNRKEEYRLIKADILAHLMEPIYMEAIENAHFDSAIGKLARYSLRFRSLWLIWLWNRWKRKHNFKKFGIQ